MSPPRITALEPSFISGYWNSLFIGIWRGGATVATATEWGRQREHMAIRHPAGFVSISIAEADVGCPDEATRAAFAAAMGRVSGLIRAAASVQEAGGFAGATKRSVVLSVNKLSGVPYTLRVFGSVGEAATWLGPQVDGCPLPVPASQIVAAIAELRAMCGPARPTSKAGARALA